MSQQHLDTAALKAILEDTTPWNEATHGPLLAALRQKKFAVSVLELNAVMVLNQKRLLHTEPDFSKLSVRDMWFGSSSKQ